ncbi:hypothetical protein BK138_08505 [Paenibacillus rhizosphaerae]|uniref:Uncharacterized protein n=1 Tax=Paenibacillus rhizosphaerae TaxID=297318 RepID=A0A1R1F3F4_9BACL|nr:hypothetical protein [Paenibacillus rhizosphaerae]OMF58542.1 hypothetical protein BK138_08505 [Paenibacillus rhizosphaerae]
MASTIEQKDISRKSFQQWKAKNKAGLNQGPGRHTRGQRQHEKRDRIKAALKRNHLSDISAKDRLEQ